VPLAKVARLEEFPRSRVEQVADRPVVQYGGQILPLLDVASRRPPEPLDGQDAFQVVVCAGPSRPVGLLVARILDIVEHDGAVRGPASRPGVEYTTVVQGRVTELLDVDALINSAGEA
jgi:two-component system chemotaxis sensor kinase CheA